MAQNREAEEEVDIMARTDLIIRARRVMTRSVVCFVVGLVLSSTNIVLYINGRNWELGSFLVYGPLVLIVAGIIATVFSAINFFRIRRSLNFYLASIAKEGQ